jgi:dihydrofolate reductase
MRKVTFGGANSLDNFFARADHRVDWILWSDEAASVMADYWKTIDTVLMGRKTYEVSLSSGQGDQLYSGIKLFVFSHTLPEKNLGPVTVLSRDVVDFTRELKQQAGKDICVMGGGLLAQPLFEAGLIDEIGFCIHPLLLGSGIPLFHPMRRQIDLELTDCRAFRNGCVLVRYRVKGH